MVIAYDRAKSERNRALRNLPFEMVAEFEWTSALIGAAKIQEPAATRFHAVGHLAGKLHVVVFTFEREGIRVISLRRAQKKEEKLWRNAQTPT